MISVGLAGWIKGHVETQLIRIRATQMRPSTNSLQHSDALKYNSCTKQAGEGKMPHPTSHSADHQRSKGYTSKCFGVFDCQLILKILHCKEHLYVPWNLFFTVFFLKAESFSYCLQLLTPIKCNQICRKSKGPAAVVSSLIYILQNWNIFYIITDRLTSSNELFCSSSATRQRQLFRKALECLQCWKEYGW